MKFRNNSTLILRVNNALGLGAYCLHKMTLFGFCFLSENSLHSKFFLIFVLSSVRSQRDVQNNSLAVQMKLDPLRLVFTSDGVGVGVGVVIRSISSENQTTEA